MDGWKVDRHRLRNLREEAQLLPGELAKRVKCSVSHYRKLETASEAALQAEPSALLMRRIVHELSLELKRPVVFSDIANAVTPRRKNELAA